MNPANLEETVQRQQWMAVLAKADALTLETAYKTLKELTHAQWQWLRPPQTGLVMVRGRAGGSGGKFNLGEVPVTRCAVRLWLETGDGKVGVAWVQGRDARHAELAARFDALMQESARREYIRAQVIDPIASAQAARREVAARKAAATKVDFYTLARDVQAGAPDITKSTENTANGYCNSTRAGL